MNRRRLLGIAAASVAALTVVAGQPKAEQSSDIDAIKAANSAFYSALSARDAKAMEAVWANKPYVINIGPSSKAVAVGYADAVAKYWPRPFARLSEIRASATSTPQVHTDGKLALVVGTEGVVGKTKDGKPLQYDAFYTNIFEKDGNRWLMISHHAQRIPQ